MQWIFIVGIIGIIAYVIHLQNKALVGVKSQEEIENERAEKFEREMLEFEIRENVNEELAEQFNAKESAFERQIEIYVTEINILSTRLIEAGLDDEEMKMRFVEAGLGDEGLKARYFIEI